MTTSNLSGQDLHPDAAPYPTPPPYAQPYPPSYPPSPPLYPPPPYAYAPPPEPPRRHPAALVAVGVLVVALAGAGTAVAIRGILTASHSRSTVTSLPGTAQLPGTQGGPGVPGYRPGRDGDADDSGNGAGGRTGIALTPASAAQTVGVVDVNSTFAYQAAQGAGTGMVLTSTGEILTNNHVVAGATSISVTVAATGSTYSATVLGTDRAHDVAVLQLRGASGLQTVRIGDSSTLKVGDAVTGVGNAGGTGGTPWAATGRVTALGRQITPSEPDGSSAQTLTGMIETDAAIQSGDSGGPLYNASGSVVGMDTAAATGRLSTAAGYAIPINSAVAIADQIEAGQESDSVHLGYPGFLGVSVSEVPGTAGALVSNVVASGPADRAGLQAGDVITRLGGTAITSGATLRAAVADHRPGSRVQVTWTDRAGASHTTTVTLATGPAD